MLETRINRAINRNRLSDPKEIEKLKEVDEEDRAIGINKCLQLADYSLINNGTLQELTKKISEALIKINDLRPSKDQYYLSLAKSASERGTCIRRQFGAVIVKDDQLVSSGYVGAPRGTPNCTDLKRCYRQERQIKPGENYELCRSVHAEMNAIIHAARKDMLESVMYVFGIDKEAEGKVIEAKPCKLCKRMIINAGIQKVVVSTPYGGKKIYLAQEWKDKASKNPFKELDSQGY